MKNFKNLLFVAVLFISASVLGQAKITGEVVDETNQPLPGASIVVKGTTNGTSTDFDGKFTLEAEANSGSIVISFIGFQSKEVSFSSSNAKLGTIQLQEDDSLDEIIITATSFAIDRKTPVAVSTIKSADIERKLGSQEFPEVVKSTPGVYATKSGGGFGDGRINLRGFNSENVAVMINGVPVNDMENGRVYWSNWAGLSDVTSAMQVQRGLGASKVAVPSIGGTINILSKTSDVQKGGNIIASTGNDGYQKYGFTLSTGLMDNGLAATVSFAKIEGEGYVDGTQFKGFNYFVNLSKEINENHKLSFTSFGAPQRHGQRQNRSTIDTYRNAESGNRFNPDWGYKNGQVTHIEDNFYHKSQTSLNHKIISLIKLDQKIGLNLILIKPGLTIVIFSIRGSFSLIIGDIFSARSNGDFLFNFERTIATFVEISLSNLAGGISEFIPFKVSGIISSPFLLRSTIIDLILSRYNSKIFI